MTSACLEVAELQQQLLWLLYDMNHLQRYPMGLGCLGELEEVAPTANRPTCAELYQMAIESARCRYKVFVLEFVIMNKKKKKKKFSNFN